MAKATTKTEKPWRRVTKRRTRKPPMNHRKKLGPKSGD